MTLKLQATLRNNLDLIVAGLMGLVCIGTMTVAGAASADMIAAVITIVCSIVQVVGLIFGIVGLVRFVIAHANEQGGDQQRAALMIATGIVLIALPAIVKGIDWASMIDVG